MMMRFALASVCVCVAYVCGEVASSRWPDSEKDGAKCVRIHRGERAEGKDGREATSDVAGCGGRRCMLCGERSHRDVCDCPLQQVVP